VAPGENLVNVIEPEGKSDDELAHEGYIFSLPIENIGTAQKACPQLAPIIDFLTTGTLPENNDKLSRRILFHRDDYFLNEKNILFKKCEVTKKNLNRLHPVLEQLCIPLSKQQSLVHKVHVQTSH